MPVNDDFLELGGEGVNALLETSTGDKVLHHVSNAHWHRSSESCSRSRSGSRLRRDSVHDRRPSSKVDTADGKWSIKSFWRGSSHQQRPRNTKPDTKSSPKKPKSQYKTETKVSTRDCEKEARAAELALQQRRERFQSTKANYVPIESTRSVDELRFEQDRLYSDIEKAVRDATRRSQDALRNK
ncbi:hypothetical protein Slin15195_G047460 [Septoria linicola]|uniref:Uncharacterized protein n=1 Tax=Septoria linicola TaxID=215465 RepID=A0A9Q9AL60_9PEZI|nr:hypothetical protein Slin14017_G050990 [Septoria linicola]USW51427.1 hypothetical protein Slin15195_G047460 [Septoria linicola]